MTVEEMDEGGGYIIHAIERSSDGKTMNKMLL
jgi:hypothetical protein